MASNELIKIEYLEEEYCKYLSQVVKYKIKFNPGGFLKNTKYILDYLDGEIIIEDDKYYVNKDTFESIVKIYRNRIVLDKNSSAFYSIREVEILLNIKRHAAIRYSKRGLIDLACLVGRMTYYEKWKVDKLVVFKKNSIGIVKIIEELNSTKYEIHSIIRKLSIKIYKDPCISYKNRILTNDFQLVKAEFDKIHRKPEYFYNKDGVVIDNNNIHKYIEYNFLRNFYTNYYYKNQCINRQQLFNAVSKLCRKLDIIYYKTQDNLYIDVKYKTTLEIEIKKNKEYIDSDKFYSSDQVKILIGLNQRTGVLKRIDKLCHPIKLKEKNYYDKEAIDKLVDMKKSTISISKLFELFDTKSASVILNFLKEFNITYISDKEAPWGNQNLIYLKDLKKIENIKNIKDRIEETNDLYEKYKLILMLECPRDSKAILRTLDDYNIFVIERFNHITNNQKIRDFINLYKFLTIRLEIELVEYSNEMIYKFIEEVNNVTVKREFVNFYNYCSNKYSLNSESLLKNNVRKNKIANNLKKPENDVYTVEQFLNLWELSFMNLDNSVFFSEIIESRTKAMTWLYLALHFVVFWRGKDIRERLPSPNLNIIGFKTGEEFINHFKEAKSFTISMGQDIVNNIKIQIEFMDIKTSKTNEPLLFVVGQTMVRVVGFLLALCESHRQLETRKKSQNKYILTSTATKRESHIALFGDQYINIFKNETFRNRKGNKTYAKYIADEANRKKLNIGYLILMRMRSHKPNNQMLFSDTTGTYLSGANADKTIDNITYYLYEAGAFSFVPYHFLSIINGDQYKKILFSKQVTLIKDFKLTSNEVDLMIRSVHSQKNVINKLILKIIRDVSLTKKVLEELCFGNSTAKHNHAKCLLKSLPISLFKEEITMVESAEVYNPSIGLRCINKSRTFCFGCPFLIGEIYFLFELGQRLNETIMKLEKTKNNFEIFMFTNIIIESYMPILSEAIAILGEERVFPFIDLKAISKKINCLKEQNKFKIK